MNSSSTRPGRSPPQPSGMTSLRSGLRRIVARTTEALLPEEMVSDMRAGREWKRWFESLTPQTLTDLSAAPREVKKRLFSEFVSRVEIEIHAKCNRVCSFCPNAILERRKNEIRTDDDMLDRVFRDLGEIDFRRQICIARYSEPMSDMERLLVKIARIRELVPRCEIAITTNTDYLTSARLEQLSEAGLDTLYMSMYLKKREKWSPEVANRYVDRLEKKTGLRAQRRQLTAATLKCAYAHPRLRITSTCHDWNQYGTERAETIVRFGLKRIGPCRDPFDTFVLDYTGAVVPCCNIRSDLPQHQAYVVGDLSQPGTSIFDVYAGKLAAWRSSLLNFDPKKPPCGTCTHRDVPSSMAADLKSKLDARLRILTRGPSDQA